MKVLHVHRIGGIGGSERHLLTLLPALAERGLEVSFLGLDDPARAPDPFYEELRVPYERLRAARDLDPRLALRVRRAVQDADVVHTHLVHADVYGAFGARRLVSTKHNDDPFRAGVFRFVERALARRAVRIIAITESLVFTAGPEYELPVPMYSTPLRSSIVGALHTAAPAGAYSAVPCAFLPTCCGVSVIV